MQEQVSCQSVDPEGFKVELGSHAFSACCRTDGSLFIVSKHNSPHMDCEAEKSPFDLSSPRNRHQSSQEEISPEEGASRNSHAQEQGRHSRHPSFPVIDYEPEHKGFYANSQALVPPSTSSCCQTCRSAWDAIESGWQACRSPSFLMAFFEATPVEGLL